MGARTGEDVIRRFRENSPEIWHRGKRIEDITREPGIARGVRSLADLYDLQWAEADLMLCSDNEDGKVGISFTITREAEDLARVGSAMLRSAEHSLGMMGREPAYLNRAVSAFSGSAEYFGKNSSAFTKNIKEYHAHIRRHDLALTHTLLNPRTNKLSGPAGQKSPEVAAHVVKERDDGIIIRGARLLATLPMADEIAVFPTRIVGPPDEVARFAFGVAIPTNSAGLKFLCRDSVDYGFSGYDHPLGSRFEELDAAVLFDDVFVPWERVFCYRDVELCNNAYNATGANAHMAYQVLCKNIAKTKYFLGLVSLMVDGAELDSFQHIHEKVSEIWVNLEVLKALKYAAEAASFVNEYGLLNPTWDPLDAARNLYPRLYPRMVEIVQQIGASGLVAMPTQADVEGPLADEIRMLYQGAKIDAHERIPLYRLAWDTAVSSFGSRQVLYERYFFGDPVQMAGVVFKSKDRSASIELVRDFLARSKD